MKKERINEIWGIFFLLLGFFTLACLVFYEPGDISFYTSRPFLPPQNYTGIIGAYIAFGLFLSFGTSSFMIPTIFLLWAGSFFLQKVPARKFFKFVGLGLALFSLSTIIALSVNSSIRFTQGGAVGYVTGNYLLKYFGYLGSFILASAILLLSLLLATDFLIFPIVQALFKKAHGTSKNIFERFWDFGSWIKSISSKTISSKSESFSENIRKKSIPKQTSKVPEKIANIPLKVKQYQPIQNQVGSKAEERKEKIYKEPVKKIESAEKEITAKERKETSEGDSFQGIIASNVSKDSSYQFPPLDLLRMPAGVNVQDDNLEANSKIIESTLSEFGIEVKVVEVEQGPVITRYELLPAPGVKVNSIAAVSDDIALALKAVSVRLIIPIPGKSAVGIEVPNAVMSTIYLREMIDSAKFKTRKQVLPLVLGKDTSGKELIADLTAMPHILIAGTTGSGKTVCINSIIAGLLYYCNPAQLKFVMIDPKMVELAVYNKIPHMITPVVTDVRKASYTLNWVVQEMERRYKLLAACGVRNIQAFNDRVLSEEGIEETKDTDSENVIPPFLPYIVVVIDELADLMMIAQDKVEASITRLAQLSRAIGIHLILATQRPSVDVITGVIKANFPARISFKVASRVDSRTVLDAMGADKLIGKGDMLFLQPGDAKATRGQASLVLDDEINKIVKFVSEQEKPEYHSEIQSAQEGKAKGGVTEKDELYDEALRIVLETRQASTSNLQRRLRLGYARAARIIDQLEAEGVIGPQQGAKSRDIYINQEEEASSAVDISEE